MNVFQTHPSVRLKGSEDSYEPVICAIPDCPKRHPHLHCPFCVKTDVFHDPVILKAHFRVKHVDKGIDFSGLKILRCCDHCEIVGTIKGAKDIKGAHWHCYKCKNGFNRRDEALKHYKTHFRNPMTTFQIQVQQDINAMMYVPQHVETVELPTQVVGSLAEDGTFYMPSNWSQQSDQMQENIFVNGGVGTQGHTIHIQDPQHQVSIAANETIDCGGGAVDDSQQGYYVMEQGQGDGIGVIEQIASQHNITNADTQWIRDLGVPVTTSTSYAEQQTLSQTTDKLTAASQSVASLAEFVKYEQSTGQTKDKDALILKYKEQVNRLKQELAAKDQRIEELLRREKELLRQLKVLEMQPVSEILDDLKNKQEELFKEYMEKLKSSGEPKSESKSSDCGIDVEKIDQSESATDEPQQPMKSGESQQCLPSQEETTPTSQDSQTDSQYSASSRTLSDTSFQSETPFPAHVSLPTHEIRLKENEIDIPDTSRAEEKSGIKIEPQDTVQDTNQSAEKESGYSPGLIKECDESVKSVSVSSSPVIPRTVTVLSGTPVKNTSPVIKLSQAKSLKNMTNMSVLKFGSHPSRKITIISPKTSQDQSPVTKKQVAFTLGPTKIVTLSKQAQEASVKTVSSGQTTIRPILLSTAKAKQQKEEVYFSDISGSSTLSAQKDIENPLGQSESEDKKIAFSDEINAGQDIANFKGRKVTEVRSSVLSESSKIGEPRKQQISLFLNDSGEYTISAPISQTSSENLDLDKKPTISQIIETAALDRNSQGAVPVVITPNIAHNEGKNVKPSNKSNQLAVKGQQSISLQLHSAEPLSSKPSPSKLSGISVVEGSDSDKPSFVLMSAQNTPTKSTAAYTLISLHDTCTTPVSTNISASRPKRRASTSPTSAESEHNTQSNKRQRQI